jgi:hypothetical protein
MTLENRLTTSQSVRAKHRVPFVLEPIDPVYIQLVQ